MRKRGRERERERERGPGDGDAWFGEEGREETEGATGQGTHQERDEEREA